MELLGKLINGWCDFVEIFYGAPVDYVTGFACLVMCLPLFMSIGYGVYSFLWKNKYHRQDILVILFMILTLPMSLVYAVEIIVKDRQPLKKGLVRRMRKLHRTGILFIERLIWV